MACCLGNAQTVAEFHKAECWEEFPKAECWDDIPKVEYWAEILKAEYLAECLHLDYMAECLNLDYMAECLHSDYMISPWDYSILATSEWVSSQAQSSIWHYCQAQTSCKNVITILFDVVLSFMQFYVKILLTLFDCVSSHYNTPIDVAAKCLLINLKLHQNMLRKHDFKALYQSIRCYPAIANGVALLIMSVILYYKTWIVEMYHFVMTWVFIRIIAEFWKRVSLLRLFMTLHLQSWIAIHHQFVNIWELFTTSCNQDISSHKSINPCQSYIGGGRGYEHCYYEMKPYALSNNTFKASTKFKFVSYILKDKIWHYSDAKSFVILNDTSLRVTTTKLTIADLKTIAASHGIFIHSKMNHRTLQLAIEGHICHNCSTFVSVFELIDPELIKSDRKLSHSIAVKKSKCKDIETYRKGHHAAVKKFKLINPDKLKKQNLTAVQKFKLTNPKRHREIHQHAVKVYRDRSQFPPDPPSMRLQHRIVSEFCKEISPNKFIEAGCAVCGRLTPDSQLKDLSDIDLTPLIQEDVTQKERISSKDPIVSLDKPVLISDLDRICKSCYKSLSKGKRPVSSLANGLWLGEVPLELSDLSYTEQLLIARVRHNR